MQGSDPPAIPRRESRRPRSPPPCSLRQGCPIRCSWRDFGGRPTEGQPCIDVAQPPPAVILFIFPPLPPGEASGISDCPRAGWGEWELRETLIDAKKLWCGFPTCITITAKSLPH